MEVVMPTLNMSAPSRAVKASPGIQVKVAGAFSAATAAIASQTAKRLQKVLERSMKTFEAGAASDARTRRSRLPPCLMASGKRGVNGEGPAPCTWSSLDSVGGVKGRRAE